MISKILRTIIGLPIVLALFLVSRFIFGGTTLLIQLEEWACNGCIKTRYDSEGLPINPYQFIKKVWA